MLASSPAHERVEVTYDSRDPTRMTIGHNANSGFLLGGIQEVMLVAGAALLLRMLLPRRRAATLG